MVTVQQFCGLPNNGSYVVYKKDYKTFGNCFLWTAISYSCHLLFAVVCLYFLAVSKTFSSKRISYLTVGSVIVSLIAALSNLIELILSYSLQLPQQLPPAYVVDRIISFIAWLLCFMLQCRGNLITKEKKRNNKYILFVLLFVILSSAMKLQFVLTMKDYPEQFPLDFVGTLVDFALNIFFFALCIGICLSKSIESYKLLEEDDVVVDSHGDTVDNSSNQAKDIYLGQPEVTKNIFSNLVFWWSDQLLRKGNIGQLKSPDDLFYLPKDVNTKNMKTLVKKKLKNEKERLLAGLKSNESLDDEFTKKTVQISLFKVLVRCFGKVYFSLGILKLIANIFQLAQPTLVSLLVSFVSDDTEPMVNGYYYVLGFLGCTLFSVLFDLHYRYHVIKVNLRLRAGLVTLIYEKALSLRCSSLSKFSIGNIVNLMSTDADNVSRFSDTFHECWSAPFQLIVCIYLLGAQVGVAAIPAVIYCILISPVGQGISRKLMNFHLKVLREKDKRIKIMCEILFGIRIIKYNAWESHFAKAVNEARKRELNFVYITHNLLGGILCIFSSTSILLLFLTISCYVFMGNNLTAAKAFTCVAIVDRLIPPLNMSAFNLRGVIIAWNSLKRIENYLGLPELHLNEYYIKGSADSDATAVKVEDGVFRWNLEEEQEDEYVVKGCCCCKYKTLKENNSKLEVIGNPFVLKKISVSFKKGQLTGITGKVGSGKSSLFASIAGEMEKDSGHVYIRDQLDGFAYCTQEPWIQHLSVRDNILFGREYDDTRYNAILYACALHEDINTFPAGDLTEIGENGVNLSGGQKARVALARAIYQDKGMYLLDDPIAAVDAHLAKHLYQKCIMGLLKDKTRILCTHHTSYLQESDQIIVMRDGLVHAQGPPDDVLKDIDSFDLMGVTKDDEKNVKKEEDEFEKNAKAGKLVQDEESRVGRVAFKVLNLYWTSFGKALAIIILTAMISRQALKNFQDWWINYWVTNEEHSNTPFYDFIAPYISNAYQADISSDTEYYLTVYASVVVAYIICTLVRGFLAPVGSVRASKILHNKLLAAVMENPISYFDVTPVGRILNRFSTDLGDIDQDLSTYIAWLFGQVASLLGTLILTCYSVPIFTPLLIPLGILYYRIQLVYRKSSRELKRINAVSRSPIYEHFTETLSGFMVIRAFRASQRFITENELKLDLNQRAEYNEKLGSIWLRFRLELLGIIVILAVSLIAVLERQFGSGIEAGLVGLAITYSIQITPTLSGFITIFTEVEKRMVRVERVLQYIEESPREKEKPRNVVADWPDSGKIVFDSVCFKYRENHPLALNDVSFTIEPGEKIGICGRTGSGKSTMLKVLLNIVEITSGNIIIDDLNINEVHNSILRSRMSIIPQDPFLFDDTISKNLDPTQSFSIFEMIEVLEKCHLTNLVQDLGGLDGNVGDRGNNFSAGQKQLLCLARALLKKSKIICIDEATASVDTETDKLIQATIRKEFVTNTVLTIAHRMDTIIDSDRVIVMAGGKVAEFASPGELLSDTKSHFYALVNENTSAK